MKYLNPFLPKETLLDTIFLLIPIFFIETGFSYWRNFCSLVPVSPNFIIVFSYFIYTFKFFIFLIYNFPAFSVESAFWVKFMTPFLLIKLIRAIIRAFNV